MNENSELFPDLVFSQSTEPNSGSENFTLINLFETPEDREKYDPTEDRLRARISRLSAREYSLERENNEKDKLIRELSDSLRELKDKFWDVDKARSHAVADRQTAVALRERAQRIANHYEEENKKLLEQLKRFESLFTPIHELTHKPNEKYACCVCMEPLGEPHALECGHAQVCVACLHLLMGDDGVVSCPVCRGKSTRAMYVHLPEEIKECE